MAAKQALREEAWAAIRAAGAARPRGIVWDDLDDDKIAAVPELRRRAAGRG